MRDKLVLFISAFVIAAICSACNESGSAANGSAELTNPPPDSPAAPVVAPDPVSIVLKSGRDFSCFVLSGGVYCKSTNAVLEIISADFMRVVTSENDITALHAFDDSICFEAVVATQPQSRAPGIAIYCIGQAFLNWPYQWEPIVFGGPQFVTADNGSAGISWTTKPFMGGDITLDYFLHQTRFADPIYSDGEALTSEETVSCVIESGTLECPNFEVTL